LIALIMFLMGAVLAKQAHCLDLTHIFSWLSSVMITTVEAPLAFLEEKKETFLLDAVEPSEVALGLVREVLDPLMWLSWSANRSEWLMRTWWKLDTSSAS